MGIQTLEWAGRFWARDGASILGTLEDWDGWRLATIEGSADTIVGASVEPGVGTLVEVEDG